MVEIGEILGQNLKRLRTERNLSLGALSEKSGVSKVMLSQIEKGDSNPTVNTLWKIVNGLGVSYSALMERQVPEVNVVRAEDAPTHSDENGAYRLSCYFPNTPERDFEFYHDVIDPGCTHETEGHGEGTEEFVYVTDGAFTMTVDGEDYELSTGDAIHFDASLRHAYRNDGDEPCGMVVVNRYPNGLGRV